MTDDSTKPAIEFNLLHFAQRRWQSLVLGTVLGLVAATAAYFLIPEQYESTAEVLVMKKNPAATSVGPGPAGDMQQSVVEDVLATHMKLISSRRVLDGAIERSGLAELPGVIEAVEASDGELTTADYISEQLEVIRGGEGQAKNAQVLALSFRHNNSDEAEQVLAAVVDSYQAFLQSTFQDVSSEALGLIERAKDEIGQSLQKDETDYKNARSLAPAPLNETGSVSAAEQELLSLAGRKADFEAERSLIDSRLELITSSYAAGAGMSDLERLGLIDDQHIQRLGLLVQIEQGDSISEAFQAQQPARSEAAAAEYDKLVSLRTEQQLASERFGPSHPKVAELRQSVLELDSFLKQHAPDSGASAKKLEPATVIEAYVKLLESDRKHFDRQIAETDQRIAAATQAAKQLDHLRVEDKMMLDRLERKRELYNAVVGRLGELSLVNDYGGYITEQISPVSKAESVWPKLLLLLAAGSVLGLGGGAATGLAQELTDQTFRSADEVATQLDAPVLGVIPKLKQMEVDPSAKAGLHAAVVAYHRPKSTDAEAVRSIRTALYFTGRQTHQVLQVTSPTPSDGKSLVSANLAVSLASAGKRVLLVDADLRKPTLHTLLAQPNGPGLSDLLSEQAELPDVTLATGAPNLSLITAGTLPPNPAELLSMPCFGQFLAAVREQYDFVLVDSPPVLIVSDPLNIAPHVDGVILVAPVKRRQAGATRQAAKLLRTVANRLTGVVVNDLEGSFAGSAGVYGGYGNYGHSYGYVNDTNGYTARETTPPVGAAK